MKASEMVKVLKGLIEEHGDQEVFSGGEDYPGRVGWIWFEDRGGNPYVPKGAIRILARP